MNLAALQSDVLTLEQTESLGLSRCCVARLVAQGQWTVRDVERAHGLPRGRRQKSRAGLSHVSDVGYDEWALLLELDGRDGHIEEGAFRDRRRDNAFAVRALLTLRYGWYDVTDNPCAVAWQVATVLRSRGWPGDLRRCGRCRALAEADFLAMG